MNITLLKLLAIILCLISHAVSSVEITEKKSTPYTKKNYALHYDDNAPTLDGILNEQVWQQATVIELRYQNEPIYNAPAPVKTIAYLYQDDTSLHIAIQAFDPEPNTIRANLREHDNIFKDDNVGIIIDTYNDKRSGFGFFVNPLGAQADLTKKETDDSDEAQDYSWNAIWHSAGKVDKQGYVVEMSIPFHALRFPDTGKELTWNLAIERNYPRENLVEIANYQQDHNRKCIICQYESIVGFTNIKKSRNIQVTPTLTLGRTDVKKVDEGHTNNQLKEPWQKGDPNKDIGLNLRWGINQNLLLNATINPDFSQVEADDAQLAINTTDALYYEEKRPFFVEGADYFTTPLYRFVHTRNIADPDYGLKITGKTNNHLYGLMSSNDNQTSFLIPGNQGSILAKTDLKSTAIIARYRLDLGKLNNIGGLVTSRKAEGYHNKLVSVDGSYWFNNNSSINYQLASSDSKNPEQVQQDFALKEKQSGQAYRINFDYRSKDLGLFADIERVDADFRADLGFMSMVNYQSVSLGSNKKWFATKQAWLSTLSMNLFSISGDWDKRWDLENNLLEEELELSATLEGEMQSVIEVGTLSRNSLYQENYYKEKQLSFWGEVTPVSNVTISTFIRFGDQIDFSNEQLGTRFKMASQIHWQLNQHWQIEAEYDYSFLDVDAGELYNAFILNTKFIWQFNNRHQLRFIAQYTQLNQDLSLYSRAEHINDKDEYLTTQLLYSYIINPQTLFYLGYADNGFEEDNQQFIRTDRTLFAKFSYAFEYN